LDFEVERLALVQGLAGGVEVQLLKQCLLANEGERRRLIEPEVVFLEVAGDVLSALHALIQLW